MENEKREVSTTSDKVDLSLVTDEMITGLDQAETVMSLTKEYLKLKKGQAKRFVFIQNSEFVKEDTGEILPAVDLMDENKQLYLSASIQIVNACRSLKPFTGIEIEYIEDEKLGGGKTLKKHRIDLLNS